MQDGFVVDLALLRRATGQVERVVEGAGEVEVSLGGRPAYGHDGLRAAGSLFEDRWAYGLELHQKAVADLGQGLVDVETRYRQVDARVAQTLQDQLRAL